MAANLFGGVCLVDRHPEPIQTLKMKKNFGVYQYFEGSCGVITSDELIQRIVLLAYGVFADYLRTLPLHELQREIESDDESTLFEYHLKPTFDFYQLVLAQGDQSKCWSRNLCVRKCAISQKNIGVLQL